MLHHALDCPEDYLWVSNGDGSSSLLDRDRLVELANGATSDDETETALVADPKWLCIYLTHIIGNYAVTIPAGGPLPEWEPNWLESVE